jgi:hypothetical protein
MTQGQLPFFPQGVTEITNVLAFKKEDQKVTYLNGLMPVLTGENIIKATKRAKLAMWLFSAGWHAHAECCLLYTRPANSPVLNKRLKA